METRTQCGKRKKACTGYRHGKWYPRLGEDWVPDSLGFSDVVQALEAARQYRDKLELTEKRDA
jgi:hypothetical protein